VRSVFLQGLLLMTPSDRPKKFDRWTPLWSKWHEWLGDTGLTPLQACLRYTLSFAEISRVIVGVDSLNQLNEVLQAVHGPTPQTSDAFKTDDPDLLNPGRWTTLSSLP
jgi:aryl-alcohol dehydrogenase-like predicted oxidoreductase